jgi:1,4-dihydroxy-2-naphthoate octaprenyltransferase
MGASPRKRGARAGGLLGSTLLNYVLATRPWTFTASVIPMVLTAVLTRAPILSAPSLCALGAGLLVHAASNLTNTYFDYTSGRDTKQESGDRALVDRTVSAIHTEEDLCFVRKACRKA